MRHVVMDCPVRTGAIRHETVISILEDGDDSSTLSSTKVPLSSQVFFTALPWKAFNWWVSLVLCRKLDEYAVLLRGAQYSLTLTGAYSC
jgi:hypothetical protein